MLENPVTSGEKDRLKHALKLKQVVRAGWTRFNIENPETVASHCWGMGLAALLYCPEELDREKVITLALIHDLAEVIVGDKTPYDNISKEDKRTAEESALAVMLEGHPRGEELQNWWQEFEDRTSPEGRYVADLDKLDMGLQAENYEIDSGEDLSEFTNASRRMVKDSYLFKFIE
ncbi:MAG: HD domain-containing protein [Euryarchaeota archaeon]|jgi:putative hydrolase of HD superfamily|nr:HD domain-containing protein [Euryarchaeota archaeon]